MTFRSAAGAALDGALLVCFSPLWVAAALAFTLVWFARFGWSLAEEWLG